MNDMIYVVTAVDTSESADGKARVLGAFRNEDDAKAFVRNDIEAYVDDAAEMGLVCDFDQMFARTEDYSYGCEWNIESVEVK